MNQKRGIVLAPFEAAYDRIRDTIANSLSEVGVEHLKVDDKIPPGAALAEQIFEAIQRASFVVADLSKQNQNVTYELGYAHALGKPSILLLNLKSDFTLPSDLAGFNVIAYDPDNLGNLAGAIKKAVSRFTGAGGGK